MTAKEKQATFIKTYLKPILKELGYHNNGATWWKDKGSFFILLNLQNFSWNNRNSVDFCFNTGVVLKATMRDPNRIKPTIHDLTVYLREGFYLPEYRRIYQYRNRTGYILVDRDDIVIFISELKKDFEHYILPFLDKIMTIQDCLDAFGDTSFWGDNLKRVIRENQIATD